MQPLTPAALRTMLRADAVSMALGLVLVVAGLLIVALWAGARRRATSVRAAHASGGVWLGDFDVPPTVWEYTASAITYAVPLPLVLFVRTFVPTWRRVSTRAAVILTTFATCAIASDLIFRRPNSSRTLNNLIAIAFLTGLMAVVLSRRASSRELRVTRIGVLAWSLTAVADNLRGMKVLPFRGPAASRLPPDEAADALLSAMGTWSRLPPADDLTMIVVDWTQS